MSLPDSARAPCVRCGYILHTGEGRVVVAFNLDELEDIATSVPNSAVAQRVLCAIGLLDAEREDRLRAEVDQIHRAARLLDAAKSLR